MYNEMMNSMPLMPPQQSFSAREFAGLVQDRLQNLQPLQQREGIVSRQPSNVQSQFQQMGSAGESGKFGGDVGTRVGSYYVTPPQDGAAGVPALPRRRSSRLNYDNDNGGEFKQTGYDNLQQHNAAATGGPRRRSSRLNYDNDNGGEFKQTGYDNLQQHNAAATGGPRRRSSRLNYDNDNGSFERITKTMDQVWCDINTGGSSVFGGQHMQTNAMHLQGEQRGSMNIQGEIYGSGNFSQVAAHPEMLGQLRSDRSAPFVMGSLGSTNLFENMFANPVLLSQMSAECERLMTQQTGRDEKLSIEGWLDRILPSTKVIQPTGSALTNGGSGSMNVSGVLPTQPKSSVAEAKAAIKLQGQGQLTKLKGSRGATKRKAMDGADTKPIIDLPPKKKGRKRKGEVDDESEEMKALRAEERQRKNRESAARSHKRKAQHAEMLETRCQELNKRIQELERENAQLKTQLADQKGHAGKEGVRRRISRTSPGR